MIFEKSFRTDFYWWGAFTAAFAVLAAYVFWGTWSTSVAPVMPDCPVVHPLDYGVRVSHWFDGWLQSGRFVPFSDLPVLLVSPYVWQELQYAVGAYLAGCGMAYLLLGRGLSPLASWGAGLLLGFSGYWFSLFSAGHGSWFAWMAYGVFAFGLCDRVVRESRWWQWVLLGAVLAWASFWQVDLWLLFTVFTAIFFAWCCVRERKFPSWKGILLAALVFFLIGTPSFVDAFTNALSGRDKQIEEAAKSAHGDVNKKDDGQARWEFVTNWSLPPEDTLEFFMPRIHGDTSCPMTLALGQRAGTGVKPYTGRLGRPLNAPSGNYRQHSLYVGLVTCLLACAGLFFGIRSRWWDTVFFASSALVFWLFSLGRFCEPVYRIVYALPFGDYLRAPVKWHHLTEFCIVVLAGYGIQGLLGLKPLSGFGGRLALGLAVLVGACDLARVDRLYCAPMDIAIVKADNPAARAVLERKGGKVADLIQQGRGPIAWSFNSHGVDTTHNPMEDGVRFVWLTVEQFKDPRLAGWLKSRKAVVAAPCSVTAQSIASVPYQRANVLLLELPDAPPPKPVERASPRPLILSLGVVSALATFGCLCLLLWCAARIFLSRRNGAEK